jgi:hypothetical protein
MVVFRPFYISFLFAFFGCSQNETMSVKKVGEIRYRRSYASLMNQAGMETDTSNLNRSLDSISLEDPTLDILGVDKDLIRKLEKIGLILKDTLLLDKVYEIPVTDTVKIKYTTGGFFTVTTAYDTLLGKNVLIISGNQGNEKIPLESSNPISLREVNLPGSIYKEMIILEEYYFMNGDMYNPEIFQVK